MATALDDLARVRVENLLLRARQIILGQRADLLEQRRARRVVEVAARQPLVRRRQPFAYVGGEIGRDTARRPRPASIVPALDCEGVGHIDPHKSCASRMPENCQRACGGKKLR